MRKRIKHVIKLDKDIQIETHAIERERATRFINKRMYELMSEEGKTKNLAYKIAKFEYSVKISNERANN
jgi:hypothetical protein